MCRRSFHLHGLFSGMRGSPDNGPAVSDLSLSRTGHPTADALLHRGLTSQLQHHMPRIPGDWRLGGVFNFYSHDI
jgi:hypothetical protein